MGASVNSRTVLMVTPCAWQLLTRTSMEAGELGRQCDASGKCGEVCRVWLGLDSRDGCGRPTAGIQRYMSEMNRHVLFCVARVKVEMVDVFKLRPLTSRVRGKLCGILSAMVAATLFIPSMIAEQSSPHCLDGVTIQGQVLSVDGKPVSGAVVHLEKKTSTDAAETKTDATGAFSFASISMGSYRLSAEQSGSHTPVIEVGTFSDPCVQKVDLMIPEAGVGASPGTKPGPITQAMEFADQPNFSIAGVTDWTAVGGHGSDSTLRTSESLASDTRNLKPESAGHVRATDHADISGEGKSESKLRAALSSAPSSFEANHRLGEFYLYTARYPEAISLLETASRIDPANDANQYDLALGYEEGGNLSQSSKHLHEVLAHRPSADLYRLAGEVDEKLGDPLSAVHEYEQAAKLNPSEKNYFEWGSELLLHRAVWQALEVFRKGVDAYPTSVRMQTAMGTALFAGARYDAAALRLCQASDLDPTDPNPYIFMGKIQMAAPNSLTCVESKLERFVRQEPNSSIANYMYAMSILKHQEQVPDKQAVRQAEGLLTKAVMIDPKCSEAYLQLGIIASSQRSFDRAIDFYKKAINADPELTDAYYRLGVAYDRTAQSAKAKEEFQLHDQIKQKQAEAIERQRQSLKQFLIVLSERTGVPAGH